MQMRVVISPMSKTFPAFWILQVCCAVRLSTNTAEKFPPPLLRVVCISHSVKPTRCKCRTKILQIIRHSVRNCISRLKVVFSVNTLKVGRASTGACLKNETLAVPSAQSLISLKL